MEGLDSVSSVGNGGLLGYNANGWNNKKDNNHDTNNSSSITNLTHMMFSGKDVAKKVGLYKNGRRNIIDAN